MDTDYDEVITEKFLKNNYY